MQIAIRGDEADKLQNILDNGIDVNAPIVSICITSITAYIVHEYYICILVIYVFWLIINDFYTFNIYSVQH